MSYPSTPKAGGLHSSPVSSSTASAGRLNLQSAATATAAAASASSKPFLSVTEPSPGSTPGDRAAGSSVPVTPSELRTYHLPTSPAFCTSPEHNGPEGVWDQSGSLASPSYSQIGDVFGVGTHSPVPVPKDPPPARPSYSRVVAQLAASPSLPAAERIDTYRRRGYTSTGPILSAEIKSEPSADAVDRSVNGQSHYANGNTRLILRKPSVVINSEDTIQDPFVSGGGLAYKEAAKGDEPDASCHNETGDEEEDDTFSHDSHESKMRGSATKFRPRGDRTAQEISSDNAQAVLPPPACVFVANLCNTLSDQELLGMVEQTFSQFGKVYVKIKRDERGMPFAFAQYEHVHDAERAITYGRGLIINGRKCRTERAKVNRSLYLHAANGQPITEADACEILKDCGDLEKLWHASETDMQIYSLPPGIWVTFAFFQDARDAQAQFKDHPQYHLDQYDGHRGTSMRISPSPNVTIKRERNIVVVRSLPINATVSEVMSLFSHSSEHRSWRSVALIELVFKHTEDVAELFALVEFRGEKWAAEALTGQYSIRGNQLFVTRPTRSLLSRTHAQSNFFGESPPVRRRPGLRSQSLASHSLATHISRALAMGVPPVLVAAIFDDINAQSQALSQALSHAQQQPDLIDVSPAYAPSAFLNQHYGMYASPVDESGNSHVDNHVYTGGPSPMPATLPYGSQYGSSAGYPMMSYQYPQSTDGNADFGDSVGSGNFDATPGSAHH